MKTSLARELSASIRGEVRFDAGSRALYATDASNYRQVPIGVVLPRDVDDVVRTVAAARRHGVPVLPRGGGTSLAGQCCNEAVVVDFTKYLHRIVEVDPIRKFARVEPGVVLDDLRAAAERHHLTFGPDPSTHNRCVLGGMIGNNSCGVHSVMAGRTSDNVIELEVLTYDGVRLRVGAMAEADLNRAARAGGRPGEIYMRLRTLRDRYAGLIRERFPRIPRRVSGYALDELLPENGFNVARSLCGSEGTCVTVLGATVRLVPSPQARVLLVLGYPDIYEAGDDVPSILEAGPIGLEGMDDVLEQAIARIGIRAAQIKRLPEGGGWLLVEFGADTRVDAEAQARGLMARLEKRPRPPSMKLVDDPVDQHAIWTIREAGLGATARVPGEPDTWEGWEDSAVAPERLGEYLRALRALLTRYDVTTFIGRRSAASRSVLRAPHPQRRGDQRTGQRLYVARLASPQVGVAGTVAGLDVNPGMLEVARLSSPDMPIAWHQASAEAMRLPDASFDVVLCPDEARRAQ